jgi:hypothetical protein
MMPEINALLNPRDSSMSEEEHSSNIERATALHELKLARKVCLELIRDCPDTIQSSVAEAFNQAIKVLQ